jgi:rhamnosyltransferase
VKRLGIAFFFDKDGIVDDYFLTFLESMAAFSERNILVCNGPLSKDSEIKIKQLVDDLIVRDNVGFDVWAYKSAIEFIGYDQLSLYDEVLFYNHTNYGPIFPFSEMFDHMAGAECDFWGITDHDEMSPNPFTNTGILPYHLNSHFIAVRRSMLSSESFRHYWATMPNIDSYTDSIISHESRFTSHFNNLGYKSAVYRSCKDLNSIYPLMLKPDEMLLQRCPIVKRRMFFGDTDYLEVNASDTTRAIDIIRAESSYDETLIWKNALRTSKLRTLNVNSTLMSIYPDKPIKKQLPYGNIALCCHVYYTEMLSEIDSYAKNIPVEFDFIATTDSEKKKAEIEKFLINKKYISNVIVRIVEHNRGRDMSSLFITCRDLFLGNNYDFVCRIHTKKTPQVDSGRGDFFKRHMMRNLLDSKGYVINLLNEMVEKPWIGISLPPIIHYSFWTIGHSWYNNRPGVENVLKLLDINVSIDDDTPVAPYGTMFWFRPKALEKLFLYEWKWDQFDPEPNHRDGSLAHSLERAICYVSQDAGYAVKHVSTTRLAAQGYTHLEHKLASLSSSLPLMSTLGQRHYVLHLQNENSRMTQQLANQNSNIDIFVPSTIKVSFKGFLGAIKRSFQFRFLGKRTW